ncbi:hypothetical protein DPMN_081541 [Dreissena polymorpha]|uniref:Uncharacterized protein n=1 Tax=Dreissena polymorpha TaxID=45954 RepID=A0A9D4BGE5_DREPO|nr:hypothetical protein DPMN_081541 [Dreissena polymorpha]
MPDKLNSEAIESERNDKSDIPGLSSNWARSSGVKSTESISDTVISTNIRSQA